MSEDSIKKSAKRHRKSEREEKESRVTKKRRKSGAAESNNDVREDIPERPSPSVTKIEPTKDSTVTQKGGDHPSITLPDTISKVRVPKKRKRSSHDASLPNETATVETDVTGHNPKQNQKRNQSVVGENYDIILNRQSYPNPTADESLSEQSRKALSYAYERCQGFEAWKFNKARQNWLLRHVWSEQAIPEGYIPLLIGYLSDIKGGARKTLIDECISKTSASQTDPTHHSQPSNDSNSTDQSRAQLILDVLREESSH